MSTKRQDEVVRLFRIYHRYDTVASLLKISRNTVGVHIYRWRLEHGDDALPLERELKPRVRQREG